MVHEPIAAAIGIGIDIEQPNGSMIADIGGGTTEIAVIALSGIVCEASVRIAGDLFTRDIVDYMRREHNLLIGERSAEFIKIQVGAALPDLDNPPADIEIRGRDLMTGIPKEIKITYSEIAYALDKSISKIEEAIMRAADFTFAFPALLSAILLTAIYGPGLVISITAIGIFNIPVFARITRGASNAIWSRDYCMAARAAGKSTWNITLHHVLPNIASVLIVQASVQFAIAILAEAALSYLGLGTQAPQPSWGRMLNEAQSQMFQAPWLAVYPGMAIAIAVLGLNLLGDGLRDLLDPRLTRSR
jgi:ABC-type amino acid transport system permease subunit